MGAAQDIFSYSVGGFAVISTITSALFYCRLFLPSTRLKVLDELLLETKEIYHKAEAERLLPNDVSSDAQVRLRRYENESDILREVTYRTQSYVDILRSMLRGHATRIMRLADEVVKLRALLMTVSQNERARKARARQQSRTATSERIAEDDTSGPSTCITDSETHGESGCQLGSSPLEEPSINFTAIDHSAASTSLHADENRRSPTCFLCSILRCLKNPSRTDQGLASFVDGEEERCSSSSSASTSSRSSTLVNEPPQRSTGRPWSLPRVVPVAIWEFLGRRTHKSNEDVTPIPCHNSPTTSPV